MTLSLILVSCFKQADIVVPVIAPEDAFINNNVGLTAVELLGKKIFFDKTLSNPEGQSCASCHSPMKGFSDPKGSLFSEGAVKGLFGTRNAPAISYNTFSPPVFYDNDDETYVGGFFWDGRANTLEQQASKPLFNHVEMNNRYPSDLLSKIAASDYADLFTAIYGEDALSDSTVAFNFLLQSVAEYERSRQVNPFSSKYDRYLRGELRLSDLELKGLQLYNEKALCNNCHPSAVAPGFKEVLFTDFTYDNIGLPSTNGTIDLGLGAIVNSAEENGKFKVPSLRNVAVTAPYFHNGFAKNLQDVMEFYNQRDTPGKFQPPAVPSTMNTEELGDLKLTQEEIDAVIAFLNTLTDGQ
jgi:cytochrome c peroxidase